MTDERICPGVRHSAARVACVAFAVALAVHLGSVALLGSFTTPPEAYFPDLAAAFLHGRLDLVGPVPGHDLTPFAGRWYVPFPPLPALLMVPLVLLLPGFSTVAFCAVLGAANVALVALLLDGLAHRGWVPLDRAAVVWLTVLFGGLQWATAVTGTVWFVGQVCAFTFAALALVIAVRAPWEAAALSGAALGLAVLGRPDLVLMLPLLAAVARRAAWPPRAYAACLAPVVAAGLLLTGYNAARFGDPFEFGYRAQQVAPELRAALDAHGQFDVTFVPENLRVMLLAGPRWTADGPLPDPRGMSLLLTAPALVHLVRARGGVLATGAWVSLGATLVPLLLYYNTGWAQFGYRFALEFLLPVLVLLAHAIGPAPSRTFRVLVTLGVVVDALGTVWWLW
jgi:hypothetical protein